MLEVNRSCKYSPQKYSVPFPRAIVKPVTTLLDRMILCRSCENTKCTTKFKRRMNSSTGMSRVAIFIWALFLPSLLSTVSARSISGPPSIEETQEMYRLLDNLQERDPKGFTYMKELALLLDKLKQQPLELMEQSEEFLPEPMALQGRPLQGMQDGPREDKRGSYMSLCHFKICNMGRKRGNWNLRNRT